MFNLIPFILILLSLGVMIAVIIKKFPQLSLLDVDSIPEVKIEKQKDIYLRRRAQENAKKTAELTKKMATPLVRLWKILQLSFRKYFGKIKNTVLEHEQKKKEAAYETPEEKQMDVKALIGQAERLVEEENLEKAEAKFIEAIRLDAKNEEAYLGLGSLYLKQGQYPEAEESLQFLYKINPENNKCLSKLAELYEEKGDKAKAVDFYEKSLLVDDSQSKLFIKIADLLLDLGEKETALESVRQAVKAEPENPRYLDKMVEIGVLCSNKKLADEAYQKLRMVNPDNQKLADFKVRIDSLED